MNKKLFSRMLFVTIFSLLVLGCGDSSSNPPATEATEPERLNDNVVIADQTQTETQTIDDTKIGADGVLTEEVEVKVSTVDNTAQSIVTIPQGNAFEDENGTIQTNVTPKIEVIQKKGKETTNTNVEYSVETEIKITDVEGKKIIPTEPVIVKIKAPANAKPGDEVRLSIPEGAEKADGQEKLVVFIVDQNGFLTIRVFPQVFRNFTVVLIVLVKDVPLDQATN